MRYRVNVSAAGLTVKVKFIDAGTGQLMAVVDIPLAELPPFFYKKQTLVLANTTWLIEDAEPVTAKEFLRLGSLTLRVRLPDLALSYGAEYYLRPTVADTVPPLAFGTTKHQKKVVILNEEDWRQVEFVTASQFVSVLSCMDNIREIYSKYQVRNGFTQTHVRGEVPAPLYGVNIPVTEVFSLFGSDTTPYDGVCYERWAGLISGGFALETSTGIRVYGQQEGGLVKALCLAESFPVGNYRDHVDLLAKFAVVHGLCLADWVETLNILPYVDEFRRYFG